MDDAVAVDVLRGLEDLSLPKEEWTHQAHLLACWATVGTRSVDEALAHLRTSISRYNEATGTPNTETSGYHETLTVYFVRTIAGLHDDGRALDDVLADPSCTRSGPLRHWTKNVLMSRAARAAWVPPDLRPLP